MRKPFERLYTDEQTDAVHFAYTDRHIRPARRVRELAEAGELTNRAGEQMPAFTMPEETIRAVAMKIQRKRLGLARTKLTDLPAQDAQVELKRRLTAIADNGTQAALERQARGTEPDWEEMRLLARAVKEIVAIPEPKLASTTPKPGQTVNGHKTGELSRGGAEGTLMRALRRQGVAQNEPDTTEDQAPRRNNQENPADGNEARRSGSLTRSMSAA